MLSYIVNIAVICGSAYIAATLCVHHVQAYARFFLSCVLRTVTSSLAALGTISLVHNSTPRWNLGTKHGFCTQCVPGSPRTAQVRRTRRRRKVGQYRTSMHRSARKQRQAGGVCQDCVSQVARPLSSPDASVSMYVTTVLSTNRYEDVHIKVKPSQRTKGLRGRESNRESARSATVQGYAARKRVHPHRGRPASNENAYYINPKRCHVS